MKLIISQCPHCKGNLEQLNQHQKANHIRWCKVNGVVYIDWNKAVNLYNDGLSYSEIIKKLNIPASIFVRNASKYIKPRTISQANKLARQRGKGLKKHSEDSKNKNRVAALNSKHRRLKKKTIIYKDIILDSSWELKLAKLLDDHNIKWIRPNPIKWKDENNIVHNYFPDFYLIDYNLYLDPKNDFARKVQKRKLNKLFEQYRNIVIMGLSDINIDFIKNLRPCIGTVF